MHSAPSFFSMYFPRAEIVFSFRDNCRRDKLRSKVASADDIIRCLRGFRHFPSRRAISGDRRWETKRRFNGAVSICQVKREWRKNALPDNGRFRGTKSRVREYGRVAHVRRGRRNAPLLVTDSNQ